MEILNIVGHICTALTTATAIAAVIACAKGLFPVLTRFGLNRSRLKIAVIADDDAKSNEVIMTLCKNKLFREKNIARLPLVVSKDSDKFSVVIVCEDCLTKLDQIVGALPSTTSLIVYAPTARLDDGQKELMQRQPVSTLVNFRGRLISDTITTLVSTQYVKG